MRLQRVFPTGKLVQCENTYVALSWRTKLIVIKVNTVHSSVRLQDNMHDVPKSFFLTY